MTKEEIYDYMTVGFVVPGAVIPYEFEDGKPCMELYGRVCDARERICERTGIDFEDRDTCWRWWSAWRRSRKSAR